MNNKFTKDLQKFIKWNQKTGIKIFSPVKKNLEWKSIPSPEELSFIEPGRNKIEVYINTLLSQNYTLTNKESEAICDAKLLVKEYKKDKKKRIQTAPTVVEAPTVPEDLISPKMIIESVKSLRLSFEECRELMLKNKDAEKVKKVIEDCHCILRSLEKKIDPLHLIDNVIEQKASIKKSLNQSSKLVLEEPDDLTKNYENFSFDEAINEFLAKN
jgi:hypothetical protein